MCVLTAVWTPSLTKSRKDSKVVFLLGFGIHELFFCFKPRNDKLTTVIVASINFFLPFNLRFRLVFSPEVTDDSNGIFSFGLIPSLNNFFHCFSRNFWL